MMFARFIQLPDKLRFRNCPGTTGALMALIASIVISDLIKAQATAASSVDRKDAAIQLFQAQGSGPVQSQTATKFAELADVSQLQKVKAGVAADKAVPIRMQANIGDIVKFDYGLSAVYVGDSIFDPNVRNSDGESDVQSFFVYRLRFRQNGRLFDRLVYNTLPPRITRELRMFQLAADNEEHQFLNSLYSWTGLDSARRVHWLAGRKDARPVNTYQRLGRLSTSSYDVYTSSEFVVHAMEKVTDLWNDKHHRVGSRASIDDERIFASPSDGKSLRTRGERRETNCFVFAGEVLEHALIATNRAASGKQVRDLYLQWESEEGGGTLAMARYLRSLGWRTYYWNPDVHNPRDRGEYHTQSYTLAKSDGDTYGRLGANEPGVKVDGYLIDYDPTPKSLLPLSEQSKATIRNDASVAALKKIRFAYGFTMGGWHSFLYVHPGLRVPQMPLNESRGQRTSREMATDPGLGLVIECHWAEIGNDLYEASPFFGYMYDDWLKSGDALVSFVPTQPYERETWDLIRKQHWFTGIKRSDVWATFGNETREAVGKALHQLEMQRVVWESADKKLYPQRSFLSGLLVVPPEPY
jgi:hypothetical protein